MYSPGQLPYVVGNKLITTSRSLTSGQQVGRARCANYSPDSFLPGSCRRNVRASRSRQQSSSYKSFPIIRDYLWTYGWWQMHAAAPPFYLSSTKGSFPFRLSMKITTLFLTPWGNFLTGNFLTGLLVYFPGLTIYFRLYS
jgi:hypothetical protein